MNIDRDTCLAAYRARDRRFDGVFFVAVKTTGIYCRPICTARPPRSGNCEFFSSASAAESQGFRPCLRCRPELAPASGPSHAATDDGATTALWLAQQIRAAATSPSGPSVKAIAARAGLSERHARRLVSAQIGATPVKIAQTARLLAAKQLLTETRLPIQRVAGASGFASMRRMQSALRTCYGLAPSHMRRQRTHAPVSGKIALTLGYRPPLQWGRLLAFLAGRAIPGVEVVDGDRYARTWAPPAPFGAGKRRSGARPTHAGWWSVRLGDNAAHLTLEVSESLADVISQVMACARAMFDLDAHPAAIDEALSADRRLRALVAARPGLRVPGGADGFEIVLRAVLGQQISVAAATTLSGRIARRFGMRIETAVPGLDTMSPRASVLAGAKVMDLASLGLTRRRAECVIELARRAESGDLVLGPTASPQQAIDRLLECPGIGPWTAQYVAMRALRWPDAFPAGDLVLRRMLLHAGKVPTQRRAEEISECWRPWRAYAAMHLWNHAAEKNR